MGSIYPGIPLPSLLPKGWFILVINLKDHFLTIPLQEQDREKLPAYNNSHPVKRYQ